MRVTMAVVLMCCFPLSVYAADPKEEDDLAPLTPVAPLIPTPKVKKKTQPIPTAPKPQKLQVEEEVLAPLPPLPQKKVEKDSAQEEAPSVSDLPLPDLPLPPAQAQPSQKKAKKAQKRCDPKKEKCESTSLELVDIPLAPLEPVKKAQPEKKTAPLVSPTVPPSIPVQVVAKAPDRNWAPTIGGTIALALGAGAMGYGIYSGVQAKSAYDRAPNAPTFDEFNSLKLSVKDNSARADVSFVIGGVLLAGGATLIILDNVVWNKNQGVEKKVSLGVTGNGAAIMGTW